MLPGVLLSPLDLNEPVDPTDRFAYGWRYVIKRLPDGTDKTEQVPLTLEDILHPQEEDFRVLNDCHWQDTHYLYMVFKAALARTAESHVLADCRVAWDAEGKYGHGPDVAVLFSVKEIKRWSTFNVVEEGTRPSLIVEVTSPSTRSTDLVDKVREYAEQGVPHYVIADAHEREEGRSLTLLDYHLSPDGNIYFSLPPNEDDRVWLPEVNLWLGIEEGQLACYDTEGARQGSYDEVNQARLKAEKKAAAADRRAAKERQKRIELEEAFASERDEMAAKVRELEAKLKPRTNGKTGSTNGK